MEDSMTKHFDSLIKCERSLARLELSFMALQLVVVALLLVVTSVAWINIGMACWNWWGYKRHQREIRRIKQQKRDYIEQRTREIRQEQWHTERRRERARREAEEREYNERRLREARYQEYIVTANGQTYRVPRPVDLTATSITGDSAFPPTP